MFDTFLSLIHAYLVVGPGLDKCYFFKVQIFDRAQYTASDSCAARGSGHLLDRGHLSVLRYSVGH